MEIERKFLVRTLPDNLNSYPHRTLEQAYLCTEPVVRVRMDGDHYELTYKSAGHLAREEVTLPLTEESYHHLLKKADGIIIRKERYCIPYLDGLTIELDLFEDDLAPLMLAEIEFETEEDAISCIPPDWFGDDVTFDKTYKNSYLSQFFRR